jgi:phage-related tail fiber protein
MSASALFVDSSPPNATAATVFGRRVNLTIDGANFTNNTADFGQGGLFYFNSHLLAADISNTSFIRNRMNFKNYSASDSAIFYLDVRDLTRFNLTRNNFLFESPVLYSNSTQQPSNSSRDNDYYLVVYSRANTSATFVVTGSNFSQLNATLPRGMLMSSYLPTLIDQYGADSRF